MDYSNVSAAAIRRRERTQAEISRPSMIRECICPNAGLPDERGYIITSPSCIIHRPQRSWGCVPIPRQPTQEELREAAAALVAQRQAAIRKQKMKRQ